MIIQWKYYANEVAGTSKFIYKKESFYNGLKVSRRVEGMTQQPRQLQRNDREDARFHRPQAVGSSSRGIYSAEAPHRLHLHSRVLIKDPTTVHFSDAAVLLTHCQLAA